MTLQLQDKHGNALSTHTWEALGQLADTLKPGQRIVETGGHKRVLAAAEPFFKREREA